jgi:3-(3-hydroxy-phenyl)propionate hydroxylase
MRPAANPKSLYFDYPEFPFTRPPELDGARTLHDVAIVGGGPVGVTAALELARHGIRATVIDDKSSVSDGSRAICVSRHSLECLQQLGLADRFMEKALPWTHGTSFFRDQPVFRLEMPHSEHERYFPMVNLQQQYIEHFLVERAQQTQAIDLRWQSRVSGVTAHADHVELTVDTPEGAYPLRARWVIAADGARSVMRSALGLRMQGDAYEGRYIIADVKMASNYPTERRAFFHLAANPGSTVLIHKQPDDVWRIDWQLAEDEDSEAALAEDAIRAKLGAILTAAGEHAPWALEWWSLYKAYTLALDDYRHARVLFAGDAAHLVPIFGVRGLNSGFADAMNAAWKLAWVVHGRAPEALLDSYSPERRGATLDVFDNASKSTRFMTPPTRGHQLMRDAALALAVDHAFTRPLINPRQSQPYTYAESALTSYRERDAQFSSGPCAGAPLANRRLADGSHLLDHLGSGFTLLVFVGERGLAPELTTVADRLGEWCGGLTILGIANAEAATFRFYDASLGTAYLVRPDRHVAARWRSLELSEVEPALRRAIGA